MLGIVNKLPLDFKGPKRETFSPDKLYQYGCTHSHWAILELVQILPIAPQVRYPYFVALLVCG